MTEITLEEFSANVDEFVWRANAGEEFAIVVDARPVVMLTPAVRSASATVDL